jgi:hypothetical protein
MKLSPRKLSAGGCVPPWCKIRLVSNLNWSISMTNCRQVYCSFSAQSSFVAQVLIVAVACTCDCLPTEHEPQEIDVLSGVKKLLLGWFAF